MPDVDVIDSPVALANGEGPLSWSTKKKAKGNLGSSTLTYHLPSMNVDDFQKYSRHELLGSRVSENNEAELCWQNDLDIREVPWLAEHVLLNQIVFPAAGFIAMVGESMRQLSNRNLQSYAVRDFLITSPLLLRLDEKSKLLTRLWPVNIPEETSQWYKVQFASYEDNQWIKRCVCKVYLCSLPSANDLGLSHPKGSFQRRVAQAYWYDVLESKGLNYGPSFRGLDEISTTLSEYKAAATIAPSGNIKYILHPITIDQCLQILMIAACQGQGRRFPGLAVVTAIEHFVVFGSERTKLRIGGTASTNGSGILTGDVSVVSEDGHSISSVKHCTLSLVPNDGPKSRDKLFSFIKWDTDATFCDLDQKFMLSSRQLSPSLFLDVLKLLAQQNAKLRILELGNGAFKTTRSILEALKSQYGEPLYLKYTYAATSLDAAFSAKVAFKETCDIDVVFFDIEQQSQSPTLVTASYDLIITTDFISSARNHIEAGIDCLKNLLHPLGRLLLLDALPDSSASKDGKFLDQVHATLLKCGFVFGHSDDGSSKGPKVLAELRKPSKHPKHVTLIVSDNHHPLAKAVQMSFQDSGIGCERSTFQSNLPQGQDVISLIDFGKPYLYNITEAGFRDFANCFCGFKGSIIWVTPAAQTSCTDPNSSMILGMARTLRAELRQDITVVEVDVDPATFTISSKALVKIYKSLDYRPKSNLVDPDYEYAIVDGEIKVPRMHWTTGRKELFECAGLLTMDKSTSKSLQAASSDTETSIRFRSDACYLLVGGLGGLGRVISTWMVENGAHEIVFLSRSAKEGPETTPFFDELRAQGCNVLTIAGSVTSLPDVEAAIKLATKPVAGVMQMSAVIRDNWISHMTFAEWNQCIQPKVQGTWNLHRATSSANLDFFLLLSSISGLSGQWGQANYNSANTFLDAFVNYRHGQNLSASVVDIGFMGCVGMAVENRALIEKLTAGGYYLLDEQDLIDALTVAIAYSRPGKDRFMNKSQLGLGIRSTKPITDRSTRVVWKKDARMSISHHFGSMGIINDEDARENLKLACQSQRHSD